MKIILDYCVSSLLYSLIAVPFVLIVRRKAYRNCNTKKETAIMLFFMCVTMIVFQTVIPTAFKTGDFSLSAFHAPDFTSWKAFPRLMTGWLIWKINLKDYADIAVNIAGNLLIFMPIGFLAPYIWRRLDAKCVLIGFLLSCFVEAVQLFTDRNSDYNDIILNTLGTVSGYLLYCTVHILIRNAKKDDMKDA